MKTISQPVNPLKCFTYKKTFIVGFGFLGISIIWPIFNQFIPIFLQAGNPEFERQLLEAGRDIPQVVGFGLPPALALFIMTWDNLINVFIQPLVYDHGDERRIGAYTGLYLLFIPTSGRSRPYLGWYYGRHAWRPIPLVIYLWRHLHGFRFVGYDSRQEIAKSDFQLGFMRLQHDRTCNYTTT